MSNEVEIRIASRDDTARGAAQAESRLRKVGKTAAATLGAAGAVAGGLFAKGMSDNMNIEVANDKLAGQLGLTTDEAKKAGEVAGTVYGDNWGSSIEDVNAAIRSVGTNLGDVGTTSKADLQSMTESALALASTFDVDVNASTAAAGALIKNGLAKNSTEAFDIITAGFQNGADKAGDFTDTLTEYSPQFKKLGFDGKYSLDLLSEGLKAGARDTDVIADGFKEFGLRAIDGSKTTVQAYKDIGLNADKTAAAIAKGGPTAQAATQQVMDGLLSIKDPIKQNNAGVALFGTTWEDTVRQILPALANADGAIEQVDGSTAKMASTVGDNAQGRIDTIKRGFEQWTQGMASSDGALGLVTTGVMQFGGGAAMAATQAATMIMAMRGTEVATKALAAATWLANGALKAMRVAMTLAMGPVGLIILGIAALVAGLIYAYKHSEKFRAVTNAVFKSVANTLLWMVDTFLAGFQMMFNVLGKLPGKFGAPFRAAANSVQGMRNKVNALREDINRVKGKVVTIHVNTQYAVYGDKGGHYEGGTFVKNKGTGGITGAASGGVRSGLTWVGEYGRELIKAAPGSTVYPHGTSENMAKAAGGGAQLIVLEVAANESAVSEMLAELIRKFVRAKGGGDVQVALGRS